MLHSLHDVRKQIKMKNNTLFSQDVEFFSTDIISFHALVQHLIHLCTIKSVQFCLCADEMVMQRSRRRWKKETATAKNLITKKSTYTHACTSSRTESSSSAQNCFRLDFAHYTCSNYLLHLVWCVPLAKIQPML